MRIGITYDLKTDVPLSNDLPDDFQEEFDSPGTIEAIASVLRGLGHTVEKLGDGRELLDRLLADPPDFIFNFAEGQGISRSREARVPAVLEMLGIPHTGSDPFTLALTLDKDAAKKVVAAEGVLCPWGMVVDPSDNGQAMNLFASRFESTRAGGREVRFPLIVKPAWEGSSKGIRGKCLINKPNELSEVIHGLQRDYRQPLLIEEYVEGDELTVGLVGNEPQMIGVMRVVPNQPTNRFVYSLEVKRDYQNLVRYECPASLPNAVLERVKQAAVKTFRLLGCRDVARVDFRLRDGQPYFLEVNPLPGLNPESSDLVILARLAGWTYERLIETILQSALERNSVAGLAVTR